MKIDYNVIIYLFVIKFEGSLSRLENDMKTVRDDSLSLASRIQDQMTDILAALQDKQLSQLQDMTAQFSGMDLYFEFRY